MNIFNRREICITRNAARLAQVKNCLEENDITYMTTTDVFSNRGRTRNTAFIDSEHAHDYYVYVHKNDYEYAMRLFAGLKQS